MTEKKEVHGTISSLPGAIVIVWHHTVIAGLTGNLRCPIGVGHDKEEERAGRGKMVGHDEWKSEMPDRGRA